MGRTDLRACRPDAPSHFVLDDFLQSGVAEEGDYGVLMAMGPGFGSELVLLRW